MAMATGMSDWAEFTYARDDIPVQSGTAGLAGEVESGISSMPSKTGLAGGTRVDNE